MPRPVFRCGTTHKSRFNIMQIEEDLSTMHLRLAGVFVENLQYRTAIARFDKATTLFYLDPPYHGCERYYRKGIFEREEFGRLAEQLAGLNGRFVTSINEIAEIRQMFRRFKIRTVATRYRVGQARQKPVRELLIAN